MMSRICLATIAISVAMAISLADNLCAQDADLSAVAAATDQIAEIAESSRIAKTQSIGGMIVSGGTLNVIFFAILGVFSLWAATVVLERMFNLRREKLLPDSFAVQLARLMDSQHSTVQEFQTLCDNHDSPASRIFHAGVLRDGRPLPEIEKAMEDAAAREMAKIRAKSRPLGVVGNIAPLVGLLGTVVGMIMAFQISSQEGLGKAELLAEGIYLALMTTAAGLAIAIPCMLFASWFQGRAERFMCDIDECLTRAIPSFAAAEGKRAPESDRKRRPVSQGNPIPASVEKKPTEEELSARERFLREGVTDAAKS